MHLAFVSEQAQETFNYNRDTALMAGLESLGFEVSPVVPVRPRSTRLERWRGRLFRAIGWNSFPACDAWRLRKLAQSVDRALQAVQPDIVLARSTHYTAWLETALPVINRIDAVFDSLQNFYPAYTRLDPFGTRAARRAEQRSLDRAELTLFTSRWAIRGASAAYDLPASKRVWVNPLAPLPHEPTRAQALAPRAARPNQLHCLTIGTEWHRKGADTAVDAVRCARRRGLNARLTIIGMTAPQAAPSEPWLDIVPSLRKGIPEEFKHMFRSFLQADAFLLPARADFTPNVIAEAYAFGVPTIASSVGAIPEMVVEGETGFLCQETENAQRYARLLGQLAHAPERRSAMAVACRDKFEAEYATAVVAQHVAQCLEELHDRRQRNGVTQGRSTFSPPIRSMR